MSDYAHSGRRPRYPETKSIESHLMFASLWMVFLVRAIAKRLMPRAGNIVPLRSESIFGEARTAASVCVSWSFFGL